MSAKKKIKSPNNESDYFVISLEKKKKIFGIALTFFSLIIILSILSYSAFDKSKLSYTISDFTKIFSNDPEYIQRAESTRNWLGLFGAYISDFLINSTIGYFSIVFPIMLFLWGYTILKNNYKKISIYISNFLFSAALIFSFFFGMLRKEMNILPDVIELSGKVGDFFGTAIGRLLGGLGSILFFIVALFVLLFIAFDIKLESIFELGKKIVNFIFEAFSAESKPKTNTSSTITSSTVGSPNDNLIKIKNLREKENEIDTVFESIKSKKPASDAKIENAPETIQDENIEKPLETKIRIMQTRENEVVDPVESVTDEIVEKNTTGKSPEGSSKEQKKNEIIPPVNKEIEESLPEQWEEKIKYTPPKLDLLTPIPESEIVKIDEEELKRNAELLKEKLLLFDIEIKDISVTPGPVVTLYELVPAPGVKISRIVSLENDIALALAAHGIRIIAPIPGKSAIGVEIPNTNPQLVSARSIISRLKENKYELPLALGKTISGEIYITDLAKMPHLLIAGSTGSGKSVGINMLITGLIYSKHPSDIKFAIIDPKKIELSFYQKLNKHFLAVSPDIDEEIITNPQNALILLKSLEIEMEKRYDRLSKAQVRNIVDYNIKVTNPKTCPPDKGDIKHYKMPYLVVIIDELADLMMTAGKDVETPIARLAQLARAVGIHLVVATQRPSVNVITGVIKANFPARIAFQTATKIDSRTILDMKGAEQLLGRGDMLFLPGGLPKPVRIQNAFISTEEVEKITNYIYVQQGYSKRYFLPSLVEQKSISGGSNLSDLDIMFEDAARVIVSHQQGSVSLLQRRLKLGYSRAARIVDQLEEAGIVGPSEGSKAREVLVETEEELETILRNL